MGEYEQMNWWEGTQAYEHWCYLGEYGHSHPIDDMGDYDGDWD